MSSDQMPASGKIKLIKFPPPGQEKTSNARGIPGGDVEASIWLIHYPTWWHSANYEWVSCLDGRRQPIFGAKFEAWTGRQRNVWHFSLLSPVTKGTLFQCFYSDVRTVKISHLEALVELKTEKNIAEVMDSNLALLIISAQEIIKVRERIPYLGPLTKVIPLGLFLVQSALLGWFGGWRL